jgi:hypothetical protein
MCKESTKWYKAPYASFTSTVVICACIFMFQISMKMFVEEGPMFMLTLFMKHALHYAFTFQGRRFGFHH